MKRFACLTVLMCCSAPMGWSGYVVPVVDAEATLQQQVTLTASWYGPRFHGRIGANGERFDALAVSVAHRTLPFGTVLEISHGEHVITATVTDRGPYHPGRELDLSQMAAYRLGMLRKGVAQVTVRIMED